MLFAKLAIFFGGGKAKLHLLLVKPQPLLVEPPLLILLKKTFDGQDTNFDA